MNWRILAFCMVLFHSYAVCDSKESKYSIEIETYSSVTINNGKNKKILFFPHTIDGYETRCDREVLVIWGKPLKINANNPQDSDVSIIDINSLNTLSTTHFWKNIFNIEFLKDKSVIAVDSDLTLLVNATNGEIKNFSLFQDIDEKNFPRESCIDFNYKSFRRYKD